jgi:hypothetical protein
MWSVTVVICVVCWDVFRLVVDSCCLILSVCVLYIFLNKLDGFHGSVLKVTLTVQTVTALQWLTAVLFRIWETVGSNRDLKPSIITEVLCRFPSSLLITLSSTLHNLCWSWKEPLHKPRTQQHSKPTSECNLGGINICWKTHNSAWIICNPVEIIYKVYKHAIARNKYINKYIYIHTFKGRT